MIGFVTGLASEAECLDAYMANARVRVAGLEAGNAERCAQELIEAGCRPLVSFGLAGGIAPDLVPGAVVIADSVISPEGYAYATDVGMTARLLAALPNAVRRPIAGSATILASPADKAQLHARTRAAAVDMESHQVAKAAHQAGIGFVAIRAVADPHTASLPATALTAVGPDGKPDIARVIAGLIQRPWDLPSLLRLGRYSRIAHEALGRVAPVIVGSSQRL
jgi:adenosylhomocysteine nucleosidase